MYLFGASGHCKVIIDIIEKCNKFQIEAILDDNPKFEYIFDKVVLKTSDFKLSSDDVLFVTIGNNFIRKKISGKYQSNYPVLIHPKAILGSHTVIDEGTVVMAGAIINPGAIIGKHCIINTGAIIEHDCNISDFVHVSPNVSLAGGIFIGEGAHIGIGASVIQGINIGKWVTIGAGSVIIKDVPDYAVVVGNPGKIIKFNKENE
jgi:sugar O-acyltransferase (sialic acid O-acetyltransferase NeuD family)